MGLINFFQNYYTALRHNQYCQNRISEIQEQRVRRLLSHTIKHSEFYKKLYSGIDTKNCRLQDLPTITKSSMMDNFDLLVTDPRLKLREIQEWLADNNNYGKLYLNEFLPILTSGSSGEYAMVVYHRKALDLIQASLFARQPLLARPSAGDHTKMRVSQLFGARARKCPLGM